MFQSLIFSGEEVKKKPAEENSRHPRDTTSFVFKYYIPGTWYHVNIIDYVRIYVHIYVYEVRALLLL